jgi:hypothetical protein
MFPRVLHILLGIWLFASAGLLPNARAQSVNVFIAGIVAVVLGIAGIAGSRKALLWTTALGGWLFLSSFFHGNPLTTGMGINQLLCAVGLVVLGLLPTVQGEKRTFVAPA